MLGACLLVFHAPAPISPLCCLMRLFGLTVNLQSPHAWITEVVRAVEKIS